MRYKEAPDQSIVAPGSREKVMHSSFRIGESRLMASDGYNRGKPSFEGFSLTLQPKTKAEAEQLVTALSDGGAVQVPLAETFFSPAFGILTDRFGVSWMVVTQMPAQANVA